MLTQDTHILFHLIDSKGIYVSQLPETPEGISISIVFASGMSYWVTDIKAQGLALAGKEAEMVMSF